VHETRSVYEPNSILLLWQAPLVKQSNFFHIADVGDDVSEIII